MQSFKIVKMKSVKIDTTAICSYILLYDLLSLFRHIQIPHYIIIMYHNYYTV